MNLKLSLRLCLFAAAACAMALFGADYDERSAISFQKGLALARSNDFRGALRYFRQASQYDSSFGGAYLNMGACHERLGEFSKARPFYEKALKLEKDNAQYAYVYALALMRNGFTEEGMAQLENAAYAEPDNADYIYELGAGHLKCGHKEQAKACFLAAVGVCTNYGAAYFQLGVLAVGEGKTNEALRLMDQVELDSDLAPQAFLAKARIYHKLKDDEKAERQARMAVKLKKNYYEGLLTLAQSLAGQEKYKEACEILERLELVQGAGDYTRLLASYYENWGDKELKAGNLKAAKTLYDQGLRFLPGDKSLTAKSEKAEQAKESKK